MPVPPSEDMSYPEAAAYIGVSERTLRRWKSQDKVPYREIGEKFVGFPRESIDAWAETKIRNNHGS